MRPRARASAPCVCDGPCSAVIVGDDADLVLMACVSWMENLYVANCAMAGQQQGIQSDMPVSSVWRTGMCACAMCACAAMDQGPLLAGGTSLAGGSPLAGSASFADNALFAGSPLLAGSPSFAGSPFLAGVRLPAFLACAHKVARVPGGGQGLHH